VLLVAVAVVVVLGMLIEGFADATGVDTVTDVVLVPLVVVVVTGGNIVGGVGVAVAPALEVVTVGGTFVGVVVVVGVELLSECECRSSCQPLKEL
jgi:hypothetical protein